MTTIPRPRIVTRSSDLEAGDLPEQVTIALRELVGAAKEGLLALSVDPPLRSRLGACRQGGRSGDLEVGYLSALRPGHRTEAGGTRRWGCQVECCDGRPGRDGATSDWVSLLSRAHFGQGHVLPDGVSLGADLVCRRRR